MKSVKTLALTLGMLLAASTFALAAGKSGSYSGQSSTPGTSKSGTQQSESGAKDRMGAQAGQGISATVQDVNQSDRTVTLRMQDGETVELQVPQQTLSTLQTGDSVEVSIRKSDMGSMHKNQPGTSGGMTRPKTQ